MRKHSRCSINEIGRVVIPAKVRKQLGLKEDTPVEIFSKDGNVHIRKHQESCIFCRSINDLTLFRQHHVCRECIQQIGIRRLTTSIG